MSAMTPLERLDAAIETYLRDTGQLPDGGFVTSWALGVGRSRIQVENSEALPRVDGMTYTFGPQTSVVQLAGLAKFLDVVAERAMYGALSEPEDD